MVVRIEPTEDQRETLENLLKNCKLAVKLVNTETMKGRLQSATCLVIRNRHLGDRKSTYHTAPDTPMFAPAEQRAS
jgi:hypothetical protein